MGDRSDGGGEARSDGRAYIGSFTSAGGRGVIATTVDTDTGALTELGATDALADPSYLALSADGSMLYAVSEGEEGAAAAFEVTPAPRAARRRRAWWASRCRSAARAPPISPSPQGTW